MTDATPLPFDLPAVRRKKLTVDFDGGNPSSDAGVLLLRAAEQKVGIIAAMADALPDRRDPARVRHRLTEIIAARVFGLCCGYEDGIDHNQLRYDPTQPDPELFLQQFLSTECSQKDNKWQGRNISRYKNLAYDVVFRAAQSELDPVRRAALLIQCNDIAIDDVVVIPVVYRTAAHARVDRLKMRLGGWDSQLWALADWYREG